MAEVKPTKRGAKCLYFPEAVVLVERGVQTMEANSHFHKDGHNQLMLCCGSLASKK